MMNGKTRTTLLTVLAVLLIFAITACKQGTADSTGKTGQAQAATAADKSQPAAQAAAAGYDDEGWTFATVPLPEGSNPPRFVSNPDGVLSADTEAELNRMLLYANVELNVESCIVAVNHVYESDVESFAYALFENFKPNNRMLVIVLAYQDKGVRMEIGHDLEAKLSEVECQQMLNNILIPYLREDNVNEGMITLVESIYHKLEGKQKNG